MAEPLADVDLDTLAPAVKRVRLAGKVYKLPGDMPLELFFKIQAFRQRVDAGEDEVAMLSELADELLALFRVHQPTLKALPSQVGYLTLMGSIGAIYGGGPGEAQPNRATRRQRKRTPSSTAPARAARATSR